MEKPDLLQIYLRDHVAAAVGGAELAGRMRKSAEGAERTALEALREEVVEDRRTLEAILDSLDVEPSQVKSSAAWLAEKLGRLKLNGRLVESSPLSRVVELEALSLAVTGKLALWRALRRVAATDPRLSAHDFGALLERGRAQLESIEALHAGAVERAFLPR